MDTKVAIAKCVDYICQLEKKTTEEVIVILLIEALTARGMMHPLTKENKK